MIAKTSTNVPMNSATYAAGDAARSRDTSWSTCGAVGLERRECIPRTADLNAPMVAQSGVPAALRALLGPPLDELVRARSRAGPTSGRPRRGPRAPGARRVRPRSPAASSCARAPCTVGAAAAWPKLVGDQDPPVPVAPRSRAGRCTEPRSPPPRRSAPRRRSARRAGGRSSRCGSESTICWKSSASATSGSVQRWRSTIGSMATRAPANVDARSPRADARARACSSARTARHSTLRGPDAAEYPAGPGHQRRAGARARARAATRRCSTRRAGSSPTCGSWRTPEELWLDTRGSRARGRAARPAACTRSAARSRSPTRAAERTVVSLIGPRARDVLVAGGLVEGAAPARRALAGSRGRADVAGRATDVGHRPAGRARRPSRALRRVAGSPRAPQPCRRRPPRCVRIEQGRPRYGVDMSEENLPGEAGIVERAVSFTKGCYVGQEPVARMYHKGHPNRHLRALRLSAPVEPGTPLLTAGEQGGRPRHVGRRLSRARPDRARHRAPRGRSPATRSVAGPAARPTVVELPSALTRSRNSGSVRMAPREARKPLESRRATQSSAAALNSESPLLGRAARRRSRRRGAARARPSPTTPTPTSTASPAARGREPEPAPLRDLTGLLAPSPTRAARSTTGAARSGSSS